MAARTELPARAATNRDGDFGSRCPYGRGKPRVGLSADSGCIIESRPGSGPHHNCRHPETSWHRPSTGEKSENDLEGVSHSTLESDRCNRFLHRGGVDLFGIATFRHPILHGCVDTAGGNWRHRLFRKWAVDGADRTESDRCRRRLVHWKKARCRISLISKFLIV